MILGTLPLSTAYQVSGATIYTGRTSCAKLSKGMSFFAYLKPRQQASDGLIQPALADEILSITVLINVR